jgi:hypothetical protein
MINIIIEPIKAAIESLDIIERISGLVIPIDVPQLKNGVKVGTNTVPVALDVEGQQCYERGQYFDMLPNSKYKSVVYFEQQNDIDFTEFQDVHDDIRIFETDLRIVFWVNHKKLGYTEDSITDRLVLTVLQALDQASETGEYDRKARRFDVTNANYTGAKVELMLSAQARRDKNIFSRYSFNPELLLPYDFAALDFHCWLQVGKDCVTPLTAQAEITC